MNEDSKNTASETFNARQELYSLSGKTSISVRKKKKIIEKLDAVYGFDLVQIISIISSGKMSGYLNIISEKNKIYGITFFEGDIIQIDNADQKTYLGTLLVSENLLSAQDLEETLKIQSGSLGQNLIKSGKISRENLVYILNKQIKLRLTQLINSNIIKVNFSEAEVGDSEIKISTNQMLELTQEWVFSCITDQWLTLHYLEWQNCEIDLQQEKYDQHSAIRNQMSELIGKDFFTFLESKPKLSDVMNKKFNKELSLKIIHLFALLDCVDLRATSDLESKDLSLFIKLLKSKQPNEVLNLLALFTKTSVDNYEKIYENLIDKISKMESDTESKNELLRLGLDIISNPKKYMTDLVINKKIDEDKIKQITTESRALILKKEYYLALSTLKQLKDEQLNFPKVELNFVWSMLAQAIDQNLKINIATIKSRMSRIRPEDKYEADYLYVMALFNKYIGNKSEAKSLYLKSCNRDAHFKRYPIYDEGIRAVWKYLKNTKIELKLKTIFWMTLVTFISTKSHAQAVRQIPIPIEYTNQFFGYNVEKTGITIENLNLKFDQFNVFVEEQQLMPDSTNLTCYSKVGRYSDLKVCNPSEADLQSGQFKIEVSTGPNKVELDPKGIVILQDTENKIDFTVYLDQKVVLTLRTVKRSVIPYTIVKEASSQTLEAIFLDLKDRKNIWKQTLNTEDLTFKITAGDFLYPTQDFQFRDKNIARKSLNYKYSLPKEFRIVYNRAGINLLAGFSQFNTKSDVYNSILNSVVGKGVKLLFEHNLDERQTVYTNLALYSAAISSEKNATAIADKSYALFDFNVGYKKYYDLDWTMSFQANFRNEFGTRKTSTAPDIFSIEKSNSISLGVIQEFTFFQTSKWNLVVEGGPHIILPQQTEFGSTQFGFALEIGGKATYKLGNYRLYGGVNYEERFFSTSEYKFNNKDIIYAVGLFYLF